MVINVENNIFTLHLFLYAPKCSGIQQTSKMNDD